MWFESNDRFKRIHVSRRQFLAWLINANLLSIAEYEKKHNKKPSPHQHNGHGHTICLVDMLLLNICSTKTGKCAMHSIANELYLSFSPLPPSTSSPCYFLLFCSEPHGIEPSKTHRQPKDTNPTSALICITSTTNKRTQCECECFAWAAVISRTNIVCACVCVCANIWLRIEQRHTQTKWINMEITKQRQRTKNWTDYVHNELMTHRQN